MINKNSKIYIAGHKGLAGSACWRTLTAAGYDNLIGKSSNELDLRNQYDVREYIKEEKPDAIIDAAAKVGGIMANNTYPYEFLMDNMLIQNNLIKSAHDFNVPKFIFLGSSCIYPKLAPQPILEEYLLTGSLEPTNQWYAIAKISGVKLIESLKNQFERDYVSLMPTNLYGPGDNFDLNSSHVLPALIRKFHEAKVSGDEFVTLWGSGAPLREFLHVEDLASAVKFVLESSPGESLYNVGKGEDLSIKSLAEMVKSAVGYEGGIKWDPSKPDGTPRKVMDSSRLRNLGWTPKVELTEGVAATYKWYLKNIAQN